MVENFRKADFEPEVRSLSYFQDDYGLKAEDGEDGDGVEEEDGEDEDEESGGDEDTPTGSEEEAE